MSIDNPTNIEEWKDYIAKVIPVEQLLHQALIIAKPSFASMLEGEGYNPSDLLVIYRAVALRMLKEDIRIPSELEGSNVNYLELVQHHAPNNMEEDIVEEDEEDDLDLI